MTINIANLEKPPKSKGVPAWADYIELLTLQNLDKEMSRADLLNRILERKDLGEIDSISLPELPDGGKQVDRLILFINDCFLNLEYRVGAFGDSYPFLVAEKGKILRCKQNFTSANKIYIFILLSANLRVLDLKRRDDISAMFEIVSLEALKNYLPHNAGTIHFGKNPKNSNQRYRGKLSKKILNLAADLNEMPLIQEVDFDARNTGDSGLDMVGYIPFTDKAEGMLYVFCQCACTEDWESKQHECSYQNWSNLIKFTSFFSHMVFMPFCFRDASGQWYNRLDIKMSILVDRVRLINLLLVNPESIRAIGKLPTVDEFIKEKESLF